MYCSIKLPFLLHYLRNIEYLISGSSTTSKSKLVILNNFVYVWNWPWQRNVAKNFVCHYHRQFYRPFFFNRYSIRFLPLLWQFFLIPNRINKFTFWILEYNVLPHALGSVLPELDQFLAIYIFQLLSSNSNLKRIRIRY